jgi:receptor protein-tyrosine kinase
MDTSVTPNLTPEAGELIEREIIAAGELNPRQIAQARALQRRHESSFADAAIALGLIRRDHLLQALSKHFNYPILSPTNGAGRFSRELVVGFDAFGSQAEALRSIRTGLVNNAIAAKTNSIAFIGPRTGVGVSYICANIALSLAQAGLRTLLVDANLRRPRAGQMFGLDRSDYGLVEAINYRTIDALPIADNVVPNLSILAAGLTPPNPQELLVSPEFAVIAQRLRDSFGIVLYDTTDTENCVDGFIVASRVGAATLVARRHKTTVKELNRLAGGLRAQRCSILGSILDG